MTKTLITSSNAQTVAKAARRVRRFRQWRFKTHYNALRAGVDAQFAAGIVQAAGSQYPIVPGFDTVNDKM